MRIIGKIGTKLTRWSGAIRWLCGLLTIGFAVSTIAVANTTDARHSSAAAQATPAITGIQMRIRPDSGPLPQNCSPAEVAGLVVRFLDAFNRGDGAAVETFFPAKIVPRVVPEYGAFQWYFVMDAPGSPGTGFTAQNRRELPPRVADRHAHHEQLTLLRLEVGASWTPGVELLLDIERSADDFDTFVAGTQASVDCQHGTIYYWAMGDREALRDEWFADPAPTPRYGAAPDIRTS